MARETAMAMRPRRRDAAAGLAAMLFGLVSVGCTGQAQPESATQTASGLRAAYFDTVEGRVTVNLPDDTSAGDTVSGTVIAQARGESEDERAANEEALADKQVRIGEKTASGGGDAFEWAVPAAIGAAGSLPVILEDADGQEIARTQIPVREEPPAETLAENRYALPTVGQAGTPTQMNGRFDGKFATTEVQIGDQRAPLFAESPRKAVAQSPSEVVGPTQLELREGERVARAPFRNLSVELSTPKADLSQGEQTTVRVRVAGLDDLENPIPLKLRNRTPGIVQLEGGNRQTITIAPEEVTSEGTYSLQRSVTAEQAGGWDVQAQVEAERQTVRAQPVGAEQAPPKPVQMGAGCDPDSGWGWIELERDAKTNGYTLRPGMRLTLKAQDVQCNGKPLNGEYWVTVILKDGTEIKEKVTFKGGDMQERMGLGTTTPDEIKKVGVSTPP